MHLYQGTTEQFIADAVQARLATQLSDRFFAEFRYKPPPSEVMAWRNSLAAMANALQLADLRDQRLDILVTGGNPLKKRADNVGGDGSVDVWPPGRAHEVPRWST
jgi:hypothetical protein